MAFILLSSQNPKTLKSKAWGYATYILHLAPADVSGYNTCPKASAGCKAGCLNTAGHGGMFKPGETTNTVQEARKRKTRDFFERRAWFMDVLVLDIKQAIKQAQKHNKIPVFRLNVTSDICWEKYQVISDGQVYDNIFAAFPHVQFYDYTKIRNRKVQQIPNYHLTFSASEDKQELAAALRQTVNIAVVMDWQPKEWMGKPVVDGDLHDLRFLDPQGCIVRLKPKGRARRDNTGFVVRCLG